MTDLLAIDWGTTNRRLFHLRDGAVVTTERDGRGVTAIPKGGFAAEIANIRDQHGDLPVLMAGMVGSTLGWQTAPYVPTPATLATLSVNLLTVAPHTRIIPGVRTSGARADVMRGEEVQLLGAVAAGLAPPTALLCQPGTHCKWVTMQAGAIADFTTAMTGELFALLRAHGVLAAQLAGEVTPGAAFDDGVTAGREQGLAAALFAVRARGVLGSLKIDDAASYASGILIGADAAAQLAARPGGHVHILADAALGALYARAVASCGGSASLIASERAFVAGIVALEKLL